MSKLSELKERLATRGAKVDEVKVGQGARTSASVTLVPGRINPFAVYAGGIDDDSVAWAADSDRTGGISFESAVLTNVDVVRAVRGGHVNVNNPDAGEHIRVTGTIVLLNAVLGEMNGDTLVPHPDWDKVVGLSRRIEFQQQGGRIEAVTELQQALLAGGFVPAPGNTLRQAGQTRLWAMTAPHQAEGPAGFSEMIQNGLHLASFQIGGDTRANDSVSDNGWHFRDLLTAFERSMTKFYSAFEMAYEEALKEAKTRGLSEEEALTFCQNQALAGTRAGKYRVGLLGVLTGSTWGPTFLRTNETARPEYAGRCSLPRLTVINQFGGHNTIELIVNRTRAET